jgi:hypothetical protein
MPSRWWWFRHGYWPRGRAYRTMARECRDPRTFQEKLARRMVYDRNPLLVTFADKLAVRDYVTGAVGPTYLPALHDVAARAGAIRWDSLPDECAVKVNHASGGTILITRTADPTVPLPPADADRGFGRHVVHPVQAEPCRMAALVDGWLGREYSWGPGGRPEWAYQHVPRRVFVEELLPLSADGSPPVEYKFLMFHGQCSHLYVFRRRARAGTMSWPIAEWAVMTPQWVRVPVAMDPGLLPPDSTQPERPDRLAEMLEVAEALAAPVDFVRVDLYAIGDRVVFGELTNYPASGRTRFEPPDFDRELGTYWTQDY